MVNPYCGAAGMESLVSYAIIPQGYSDGYDGGLSNKGYILLQQEYQR